MTPIRLMVADDHPLVIQGLTTVLRRYGVEVVGQASFAEHVIDEYQRCLPDVLVTDIRFGLGQTGLEVAYELLKLFPQARIVFYSQYDQIELIRAVYQLGGAAFITKHSATAFLAEAIERVSRGGTYMLEDVSKRLALLDTDEATPS